MSAREEILARVRGATSDVSAPRRTAVASPAPTTGPADPATLELFAENVADYRARVVRTGEEEVAATVAGLLAELGCRSVIVPRELDSDWVRAAERVVEVRRDTPTASHRELDATDAVVTAAAVGIATTGTVVLDHRGDQGRRALTLVPDVHVCVIRTDQVVHDVPESVTRLRPGRDDARPLTWISGPSATSDIELERVEGVHGPRTLVVVIAG